MKYRHYVCRTKSNENLKQESSTFDLGTEIYSHDKRDLFNLQLGELSLHMQTLGVDMYSYYVSVK